MVFSSPLFLFGFLPLVFILYGLSPARWRNAVALGLSLFFYAWGEPRFVFIAMGSALLDLLIVRAMAGSAGRRRRLLLAAGVAANLGLLVVFKYTNFLWSGTQSLAGLAFGASLPAIAEIALPIGISFIVFEKITYVVDVYRGIGHPAKSVRDYLLYVFLFPKLLAGPIIKYHDIEPQLGDRPSRFDDVAEGLRRFSIGLAKKVLVADTAGELADMAFAPGPGLGFGLAWLGALAYAVQIYFDFSGYSDMAIGIARMMGFRLMENFNQPYIAVGFRDFWHRWHISLTTWIRDYLYIPLGGDRASAPRTYVNLWICFLASGLWHGAAWTFIAWGAFHGLFLTLDRLFMGRLLGRLPKAAGIAVTFLLVTVGWVIFRAPDLASAVDFLAAMADPGRPTERIAVITGDLYCGLAAGLVLAFLPAVPAVERLTGRMKAHPGYGTAALAGAAILLVAAMAKAVTVSFQPFLYFRF